MYARVLFIRQCKYTQFFKKYVFFIFVDLSEVLKSNLKNPPPNLNSTANSRLNTSQPFRLRRRGGSEVSVLSSC